MKVPVLLKCFFFIALATGFATPVFAQNSALPAFPGAEGFGKYTEGGRGGRVIYVTTLEDSNSEGSLRYAVNQTGPRIVLFKVSGTIRLKSDLKIRNSRITIAGQTAPGDGITLRDYPVTVQADEVVIRFLRFRMGNVTNQEADALGGRYNKNVIIDHCSMSWSTDECVSFYDNENFTLQWCLLSESLRISVHDKGKHGYGGIWGGANASFHHNLLAHHDSRNPRFCGSRYSNNAENELVDFRNNVIYNWGANSVYGGEGGHYNLVNNYYKAGPATSSNRSRIIQPYADNGSNSQSAGVYGKFFIEGNFVTASSGVTNDNWAGVNMHSSFTSYAPGIVKNDIRSETAYNAGEVTTHPAEQALEKVVAFAGASLARDPVDTRIADETATGTVTYPDGGFGSTNGLVDTQEAVGGWPELSAEQPPADSDNDGMPDDWEVANNLNPYNPDDAQMKSVDGVFPNVEVYLNSLVADIVAAQNEGGISTSSEIKQVPTNDKKEVSIYIDNKIEKLFVVHSNPVREVKVYAVTGQLLISKLYNENSLNVDVRSLKNGVYIVLVRDAENHIFSEKILKL
ncbi:Por secretion system C-terminal sorting domain-containing protein [Mariniphaga anaerophila]|uniref:Por secretion system C-terminal sorting domain-containing protein n=1 Tax=Mariniphaga anaerophila TaxID=1484053 RepID=A0A1M5BW06_9BACT|nr:T9SS type A sorting domain-containing protein [Mariniphaga anaerophila]SHF46718.1 Por secretion system C-terminal sorting domain-containing protein [Mariniphaga anaerophila]